MWFTTESAEATKGRGRRRTCAVNGGFSSPQREHGLGGRRCLRHATPNMLRTRAGAILVAHRLPEMTIHASFDVRHSP